MNSRGVYGRGITTMMITFDRHRFNPCIKNPESADSLERGPLKSRRTGRRT
jgi:hypothetical protein